VMKGRVQQGTIGRLLDSKDPSVAYQARIKLAGMSPDDPEALRLREQIRGSQNARRLLSHLQPDGTIATNPYKKWQGPLFTLLSLALLDYPPGDARLHPIRDQAYGWLLSDAHLQCPRSLLIPGQEDRFRRCAGQEAHIIWATLKLGIADERTDVLAGRLKDWQWPDGGWNCDKRPGARKSSFHETLQPMRALNLYGRERGDPGALAAARRAAEVFLKRRLFRRQSDGEVIDRNFTLLTFPYFYHYNILFALVTMTEAGLVEDPRCAEALDLLAARQRQDGGFPLERRLFAVTDHVMTRGTFADWGPTGKRSSNPFVTVDALYVLRSAGRL